MTERFRTVAWTPMEGDDEFLAGMVAATGPLALPAEGVRRLIEPHLPVLTSDLFQALEATDDALDAVAAHLVRNVDVDAWSRELRPALADFARRQQEWLDELPELVTDLSSLFPENLRGVGRLRLADVRAVALVDGIALYAVPRPETARALLEAGGASERRDILGGRWRGIAADCRAVVAGCASEATRYHRQALMSALDALVAGHDQAAQAMAAPVIDALCRAFFHQERGDRLPRDRDPEPTAFDRLDAASFLAFSPLWQTYQRVEDPDGETVPYVFNVHATTHTVHPLQYSRRNAVQALMFATSLLKRLDEEWA